MDQYCATKLSYKIELFLNFGSVRRYSRRESATIPEEEEISYLATSSFIALTLKENRQHHAYICYFKEVIVDAMLVVIFHPQNQKNLGIVCLCG